MSVRRMIRKELERKLRKHRKEALDIKKDLDYLNRAGNLIFYVFVGTGWKEQDAKVHYKACGRLGSVIRAAVEELKRQIEKLKREGGPSSAQGEKYICMAIATMPSGDPVFIPQKFFMPYLEKYGKHS